MNASNIANHQGDFGSLHPVGKVRKEFICRECNKTFQKGSLAYNQADHRQEGFFPVPTKLCIECGEIQIENGIEVKERVKKPKKKKVEGCGEDTCYPKPHSEEMWKCGESASLIGAMLCNKCVISLAEKDLLEAEK